VDDARRYLLTGPIDSYERHGFGMYRVALKDDDTPVGICGLVKRDSLDDVDIGFAFLPDFRSKGYAFESASAVLAYARRTLGMRRIVAITTTDNAESIRLLETLGLKFEKTIRIAEDGVDLELFALSFDAAEQAPEELT
jgi:RimJ/RimL family protein N-acetyltransferase